MWLLFRNSAIFVFCSSDPLLSQMSSYHSAVDEQCQRTAWGEFHSIWDQYQIKTAWDPITRTEIKLLLSGRTGVSDKIQKDHFPFLSSLTLPHIAPRPLAPFPSCSGELCDKLTVFQRAEDRSHSVRSYSTVHLLCCGGARCLPGCAVWNKTEKPDPTRLQSGFFPQAAKLYNSLWALHHVKQFYFYDLLCIHPTCDYIIFVTFAFCE